MPWTSDDLVEDVKGRGSLPTAVALGTATSDILRHAYSVMLEQVVPLVQRVREQHFRTWIDQSLVAGKTAYMIPYRALALGLRWIERVDAAGAHKGRITMAGVESRGNLTASAGEVEGNRVRLFDDPGTTTDKLRFHIYMRPNRLVSVSSAWPITAIDTGTGVISVTGTPTGTSFDLVRAKPGFDTLGFDVAGTGGSGSLTVAAEDIPDDLEVGDYVAIAQQSPIPQVPPELHGLLAELTCARILRSLEMEAAETLEAHALKVLQPEALVLLANRIEGEPQVMVPEVDFFGWSGD